MQLLAYAQRRAMGASGNAGSEFVFSDKEREKATQVEVQRKQVDEVFKSLDNGTELEQSDPGKCTVSHVIGSISRMNSRPLN